VKNLFWNFSGLLIILTITLVACNLAAPTLLAEIDQAEQRWQDQGIDDYRLEVLVVNSIWHAQTHQLTVRDGLVVEQSAFCIPAPFEAGKCTVEPFDAAAYTIPGLFAQARAKAQQDQGQWTELVFDPTYSFPSRIAYDHPEILDEDNNWQVKAFEPLP
jgi:hypothetical protein